MNRFKFNDGNGALVCNDCDRIIQTPISPKKAADKKKDPCPHCKK